MTGASGNDDNLLIIWAWVRFIASYLQDILTISRGQIDRFRLDWAAMQILAYELELRAAGAICHRDCHRINCCLIHNRHAAQGKTNTDGRTGDDRLVRYSDAVCVSRENISWQYVKRAGVAVNLLGDRVRRARRVGGDFVDQ